ncbi:F-box only protein 4 [Sardina pilchardus]|uniref:F-box only protein 4 n=1 Tax=Sardina pilchardus TaxID=27697 RepID=UPI002E0D88AB
MATINRSNESLVIGHFRNIKDRLFGIKRSKNEPYVATDGGCLGGFDTLPVEIQFLIMTFLSPQDLCRLGGTSRYWRALIRDPSLWKYLLLRDMPLWSSIDHLSMPDMASLERSLSESSESESRDFMADYLKVCPSCRSLWHQSRPAYGAVTSFLKSMVVTAAEPRFAMFGPGLEKLEVSLVTTMLNSPHILPVTGVTQRQINGIGSGISFMFNDQQKFNILTLYSTNRSERERARLENVDVQSRLFIQREDEDSGRPTFDLAPNVQEVCLSVDGFIFVTNAERGKVSDEALEKEFAQIEAMLEFVRSSSSRPLLVLSCVAREGPEWPRVPCLKVAQRLRLSVLQNPWMVQDTVAETLSGLRDGILWLLRNSGIRL